MANSGKVTEIIDTAATTGQYKTLSEQVDMLDAKFVNLTKTVIAFNNAAKDAKGFADFNKNAAQAAINSEKLLQVQNQTAISAAKLAEQEAKVATALQRQQEARDRSEAKKAQQSAKSIADSQKRQAQDDKETKAFIANQDKKNEKLAISNRAFNILQQKTNDAVKNAKDIGASQGINSQAFKDATENAAKYQDKLNGIKNALGDETNKVGQYTKGIADYFGKAFSGIRTLANIIPNFGIGTFFLILGTGIVEIVKNLDILKDRLDETTSRQQAFANAVVSTDYKKGVEDVLALTNAIKLAKEGIGSQDDALVQYNETLGQTFGQVTNLDDAEKKLVANSDNYIKSLFYKAAAQAVLAQGTDALIKAAEAQRKAEELSAIAVKENAELTALTGKDAQTAAYFNLNAAAANQKKVADKAAAEAKASADNALAITSGLYRSLTTLAEGFSANFVKTYKFQEETTNYAIEHNKRYLQNIVDTNTDIANNEQKSYAARQAALRAAQAAQIEIIQLSSSEKLNTTNLSEGAQKDIIDAANYEILKNQEETDKKSRELRSKANKDDIALDNQRLERQKKISENKFSDPTLGYQDRFNALDKYEKASIEIIRNAQKIELEEAGQNAARRKAATEKAETDILDVKTDKAKKTLQIQKDINDQNTKFRKGEYDSEVSRQKALEDIFINSGNSRLLNLEQYYSDELSLLGQQYVTGKIRIEEYNRGVIDLDRKTALARVQIQLDTARKIIASQSAAAALGFGDPKALQKSANDLVKLQIEQSNLLAKTQIDNIRKVDEARRQNADFEKQVVADSINLIQQLIDNGYENQIKALQEKADQVDENATREKEAIDNSLISSQQKADKDKIIDAQAADAKKAIAEEQKQIKIKEANFNKAVSLFNIAINTAESVAKIEAAIAVAEAIATIYLANPLTAALYPGIAALIQAQQLQVGLVIASGALQAAAVAASSPKYAKGTKNHPGGTAWVGDAGFELVKLPDGNSFLTENRATFMDLPSGTTVVPHLETVNLLQKINYAGGEQISMREANRLLKENNQYQRKIANKPIPNFSGKGIAREIVEAQNLNNRRTSYFK